MIEMYCEYEAYDITEQLLSVPRIKTTLNGRMQAYTLQQDLKRKEEEALICDSIDDIGAKRENEGEHLGILDDDKKNKKIGLEIIEEEGDAEEIATPEKKKKNNKKKKKEKKRVLVDN
jgi:hypothetical protein